MLVRLKEVASFSKGQQINGDELLPHGKFAFINGGINPSGMWNESNVEANSITISEGGNSCGHVNFFSEPFWCGAHCYYLFDTTLNSKYLYYALKSQQERIMALRSGACMPNIKKTDLGEFEFVVSNSDAEQQTVVAVFDRLETIIALRKQQIAKLDELVKARFVEMFGDPVDNPMCWTTHPLDAVCNTIVDCPHSTPNYTTDNTGFMCIRTSIVKKNKILWDEIEYIPEEEYKKEYSAKSRQKEILFIRAKVQYWESQQSLTVNVM